MSNAETILAEAIEIASPQDRAAFLEQACEGDPHLLVEVTKLVEDHFRAGNFLEQPAAQIGAMVTLPPCEAVGDLIGPYKLLQQIGEGGMGTVYMAEQAEPVQRKVALKIIKPGMDSRKVIARFEAERQALALMDHPNIAKILDASTTENGRPYFVMELVKGVPIIQYCDEHRLIPRQRLQLFITVCQAVQHAHQKGIIHRDLKPTNILVADYDDKPVAKIIDFGVAKAIGQQLTERTMFTEFGQVIGTMEYMSPEQAKLNQLDIDTRSDIYSLGVLLYELLSGETPFDRQRLRIAAFDEMLRIIREEEPPPPSTRLSSSQSLPAIAANRQLEPKKLTTTVSGDLDWIVMKAIEKDRTRRYETASGFADDIQRYLSDQPVEARRPTRNYRLKKFIRRHKAGVLAATIAIVALVVGSTLATIGLVRARHEEQNARTEATCSKQVAQFFKETLEGVLTSDVAGRDTTLLREIVDKSADRIESELHDQPAVEADLLDSIGDVYFQTGPVNKAELIHRKALEIKRGYLGDEHLDVATSLFNVGAVLWRGGNLTQAEDFTRQSLLMRKKLAGPDSPDTVQSMVHLGGILDQVGKLSEADAILGDAVRIARNFQGENRWMLGWSLYYWARTLDNEHKYAEAENAAREAAAVYRSSQTQNKHGLSEAIRVLGTTLLHAGKLADAETVLGEAIADSRQLRDAARDPYLAFQLDALATVLSQQGRLADAESLLRESLEIRRAVFGDKHQETIKALDWLIKTLERENKIADTQKLRAEFAQPSASPQPKIKSPTTD